MSVHQVSLKVWKHFILADQSIFFQVFLQQFFSMAADIIMYPKAAEMTKQQGTAVHEVSGVTCWQLPATSDWGADKGRWTSSLKTRKNWIRMWRFGAALATVTVRWWNSESWGEGEGRKTGSPRWVSAEQILVSSQISFEKSHGQHPWREEGSRKAGSFSRIISSRLRNDSHEFAGNQANGAGGLHEQGAPEKNRR